MMRQHSCYANRLRRMQEAPRTEARRLPLLVATEVPDGPNRVFLGNLPDSAQGEQVRRKRP